MRRVRTFVNVVVAVSLSLLALPLADGGARAQAGGPTILVPNLGVRAVAENLVTPTSVAFLGPGDMLVLEKDTG
ncbi:MAG TPA: hypothetical protein VF064_06815, partial [Pyrinomonadaceae bacterium]